MFSRSRRQRRSGVGQQSCAGIFCLPASPLVKSGPCFPGFSQLSRSSCSRGFCVRVLGSISRAAAALTSFPCFYTCNQSRRPGASAGTGDPEASSSGRNWKHAAHLPEGPSPPPSKQEQRLPRAFPHKQRLPAMVSICSAHRRHAA